MNAFFVIKIRGEAKKCKKAAYLGQKSINTQ
jgi:hypothetical protein